MEAVTEMGGGYDIAAVMAVVILVAAWLLIYNVLHISYGKDIRRFGLLKTLGTTGRQIRSIAYRQIFKIAVLGCLWGSLLRNAGYISRSRRCYPENRKTFSRGIDTIYGKSICREKK